MFTPTQKKMVELLSDGCPHSAKEIRECFNDELSLDKNLSVHIHLLRKKLRMLHHDILTEWAGGGIKYRHIILLPGTRVGKLAKV